MNGTTKCHYHGGKSAKGVAAAKLKSGMFSRLLPKNLLINYERQLADPDLLALREQIALTDALTAQLVARLKTTESDASWGAALGRHAELNQLWELFLARDNRVTEAMLTQALAKVGDVLHKGVGHGSTRAELRDYAESRRRLSETEHKRVKENKLMITAEQQMVLIAAVFDIFSRNIQKHVTDGAVANEIMQGTGRNLDQLLMKESAPEE